MNSHEVNVRPRLRLPKSASDLHSRYKSESGPQLWVFSMQVWVPRRRRSFCRWLPMNPPLKLCLCRSGGTATGAMNICGLYFIAVSQLFYILALLASCTDSQALLLATFLHRSRVAQLKRSSVGSRSQSLRQVAGKCRCAPLLGLSVLCRFNPICVAGLTTFAPQFLWTYCHSEVMPNSGRLQPVSGPTRSCTGRVRLIVVYL